MKDWNPQPYRQCSRCHTHRPARELEELRHEDLTRAPALICRDANVCTRLAVDEAMRQGRL